MQHGRFLRSWIFQVAFFCGCGLCRYAKLEWINKNQDKAASRRQYR